MREMAAVCFQGIEFIEKGVWRGVQSSVLCKLPVYSYKFIFTLKTDDEGKVKID